MNAKITPCLWFDTQAEQAAEFYVGVFKDARITHISRYGEAGKEQHGREPGSVMVAAFELKGQPYVALNGGPHFTFSPAVSFQVDCENQEEIDYYWEKLSDGGAVEAQQCGWLADKFGLSWQIVPVVLKELLSSGDEEKSQRAFGAMMQMKKLDIAKLQQAYDG